MAICPEVGFITDGLTHHDGLQLLHHTRHGYSRFLRELAYIMQ